MEHKWGEDDGDRGVLETGKEEKEEVRADGDRNERMTVEGGGEREKRKV